MTVKILSGVSHTDHGISTAQMAAVLGALEDGTAVAKVGAPGGPFFIAEVTLPASLGVVPCALRGPTTGEQPVGESEVFYGTRGTRPNVSRLTRLPKTVSRVVTVIGGLSREHPDAGCVLYTAFGGPLSPQEPGDPFLAPEGRAASLAFWAQHALAVDASDTFASVFTLGEGWETYSAPAPGK